MFLSRSFFIAWRVVTASDCTKLKTIKIIVFFYKPIKWIYTNGFTLRECARGRQGLNAQARPCSSIGTVRKRATSRPGGAPNRRLYSRLNCDGLS